MVGSLLQKSLVLFEHREQGSTALDALEATAAPSRLLEVDGTLFEVVA